MTKAGRKYFADLMDRLSIPFDFAVWKAKPPDRYFVGEMQEDVMTTLEEDRRQDTVLYLRGFSRVSETLLMNDMEVLEKTLPITDILPDGTGIAIMYEGTRSVLTTDNQLDGTKTNIRIKEWKVN